MLRDARSVDINVSGKYNGRRGGGIEGIDMDDNDEMVIRIVRARLKT